MGTGDVVRLLRRHWLFLTIAAIVGAAAGLGWAATRTPEYTAKAEVFVTVTSGQSTGELAQGSSFAQQQARNFAAVVAREIVLAPVIRDLDLDMTVSELRQSITTTVPLNTSLVTIQAVNSDPKTAAEIANSAAKNLEAVVSGLTPKVGDLKGAPVRAELIETAAVPTVPSSPDIILLALFGLLGGLVVGVAYQVVTDLVVARVTSADQLKSVLGTTLLGTITRERGVAQHPIAVTSAPLSLRAEEVRQVRTALKFLRSEHQVFVVSSAISGEGKTTTAANIAAAFAAGQASTCLVEADLRRPRVEQLLDLAGGAGLSDVIVGDASLDDALQTWGPDNLGVLVAGSLPPNPSELLQSTEGVAVLNEIKDRFDVVVIDTPPLTAVTDASIIGQQFGGVLLVSGAGRVRAGEVKQAAEALKVADVPLLGSILNLESRSDHRTPYAYAEADTLTRSRGLARSWMRNLLPTGRRWKIAGKVILVLVLAAALVAAGVMLIDRSQSAVAQGTVTTSAHRTRAVFLGDSLTQGVGGDGITWTGLMARDRDWTEINLGRGGTGYVTTAKPSACGRPSCPSLPDMTPAAIAEKPDVVIIQAGQNDGKKDVATASLTMFTQLREALPRTRIVVLSPLWRATAYPKSLTQMSAVLKKNAATAGIDYVDVGNPLQGRPDLFTVDGVHPTAEGYRVLATAIEKAVGK